MTLNRLSLRRFSAQIVPQDDGFHMVLVSYLWLPKVPGTSRPKFQHRRTLIVIPALMVQWSFKGPLEGASESAVLCQWMDVRSPNLKKAFERGSKG